MRELFAKLDLDPAGWNGAAGREAVAIITRLCRAEAGNWVRRAGHLGDVGVGPAWEAMDAWRRTDRSVDPMAILRRTIQRVYAAEAGAVELGAGDPVRRPKEIVRAVREPHALRRADVDLSLRPVADDSESLAGPEDRPAWLQVTAALLVAAGWQWPQPAGECLAAMAAETSQSGRRSATTLARRATGVPPATWSALALLAAGSGPGCAPERMWPGVPAIHRIGGAEAVRENLEVRRIVRGAVAGRPVRSGRAWLVSS
ncbi:hypothetical protein [Nakamurella lactea]|uniref:hypothetical protein n=1 Tax=Nakamurella lactea TaxID=459515 RepID=UPI00041B83F5|nr:hypothetical protein [Nakamurella lactea]